jgi:23S rRNA (uracil1939-C5)-methyltransferase
LTGSIRVGSVHEIEVTGVTSEGAGVGRLPDGRAVFVHRTAPGDRARVEVTRVTPRWGRARLLERLEAGPDGREAPCPYYAKCGGCTLQHLEYPAQVAWKERIVLDALSRIGGRDSLPAPVLHPSPLETGYRNRMGFTLRRGREGSVVAGFRRIEQPERVLDVDGRCLLPEAPVARAWEGLRAAWGPGARRLPTGPELRLTLRATAAGEVLLLIEGGRGRGDPDSLLERVPELRAIWGSSGAPGSAPRLLAGVPHLEERWLGEDIELHPRSFLQVNRGAAEILHREVLRTLGPVGGLRLVDAYCGFGTYARRAAREGATAVGIETDPGAVAAAAARPEAGFELLQGRVEERLEEALPADRVILNPPRAGVAPGVMEKLAASGPDRIVYVSCDPATLARDLGRLGPDFRVARIQVFDLFPQTARVETVLTLDRD